MTFGLAFTIYLTLGLAGVLVLAHLHDRRKRVVTCPLCNGDGTIPVAHPSGDPQREGDTECLDCVGEGKLTAGELRHGSAADAIADRIERELSRHGAKVIVSHYPGLEPEQRWETGAMNTWGQVTAGPVTGPSRLTAVSRLAAQLGVDVRRITS